ncbi:MAG: hypothetical protein M5R37_00475 [Melioribacteraceae bacterium]|nr:hypothetical protein [Melioribacteraceae bacterium]
MTKTQHNLYVGVFILAGVASFVLLIYNGFDYYTTSLEERFFNPSHTSLKPSGSVGHGLGIIGSLMMLIGVGVYIARKRIRQFGRIGLLKHWLEFHIFLCSVGPMFVLFHTAFKFGGIVAVSFWSMIAVVLSGVIGRYIYIQIPRSISGKELSLNELRLIDEEMAEKLEGEKALSQDLKDEINNFDFKNYMKSDSGIFTFLLKGYWITSKILYKVNKNLTYNKVSKQNKRTILKLTKTKLTLNRRIKLLRSMQSIFRYWHIFHLPFAIIMLIIMLVHVGVTLAFGYKWIF